MNDFNPQALTEPDIAPDEDRESADISIHRLSQSLTVRRFKFPDLFRNFNPQALTEPDRNTAITNLSTS